ncbi:Endo-1,3(4)-beta-glucanase 1 [Glycine soja]|uniref:glucan endo-1,3-beta-D-glucosidase n=1 Tax=Glycine soja TaxID=3848 RepID=A0A0B2Q202_GLYSO|nr:Endo-1,3(4)-beta-glucanase 1 [Glycine soja]
MSSFLFPQTQSTVLSDPSTYFSSNLVSSPLPTNSFFQNFALQNGTQAEYIHPYLIKTSNFSLSASCPLLLFTTAVLYQTFVADITISSTQTTSQNHVISSYSDLGVTLDIPSSNLRFFLLSGNATLVKPFRVTYEWQKKGPGFLLTLAHPLHVKLLQYKKNHRMIVLRDFKYRSIDGDLVGVVGDSWLLKTDTIPVTWHSNKGVEKESHDEIVSALSKDVEALSSSPIATESSYYYGKLIGRAARLALIAEEVSSPNVIPTIQKFLKDSIEPWLDGTFQGNGFLYENKWGGLVTKQGSTDSGADFGFGVYNDHHYHLGYFLYGIAVLAKVDLQWGQKYKPQVYSLVSDFMNSGQKYNSHYPRLRCFDLYKLHSWTSGVTEFTDGRNQESTSEAVNAYYSAALVGLAYDDSNLVATGSTLLALEILAAQTWWHVKAEGNLYEEEFAKENKIVDALWANKRDSALWWAPATCRECRLGIEVLPLSPVTETLFYDADYVKELVEWTMPSLTSEGWKGMTYALQGIYDKETVLQNIRMLTGFDDGNSFTNLLWWIHSR